MTAETVLDLFVKRHAPLLWKLFAPNTCIEQTRVLVDVMKALGIEAEAMAMKLHLVCPARGFQYFISGDPRDYANARKIAPGLKTRSHGGGEETFGYHIVALIERRLLVDLTIAQVSNDEYDFHLEPQALIVAVADERLAADALPAVELEAISDNDLPFTLKLMAVEDRTHEATPAWEPSHLNSLIAIIAASMQRALPQEVVQ